MNRIGWLACGFIAVLAKAISAADNNVPKQVREAFEKATEIELYSLDPSSEGKKDGGGFHDWKVLGKVTLKGDDAKKVWAAIDKGRKDSEGIAAACFIPRHGLRVVYDQKTYDLVICYECLSANVFEGDKNIGGFLTTRGPAPVLNKLLKDAKVALPEK